MQLLETVTRLSHRYGTAEFVKGGGGNTSAKDAQTLWIKPSGTTLAGLTPERFTALSRPRIDRLYEAAPPGEAAAREALVASIMAEAVLHGGRPSVEAPLHNVFDAAFVVHTHPPLVNAMTCGRDGEATCREQFPEALWIDYIDPGYTLCMAARRELDAYTRRRGCQPAVVMLRNHGVFVAGDTPAAIDAHYRHILATLAGACRRKGIPLALEKQPAPAADDAADAIRRLFGEAAAAIVSDDGFRVADGPLTPDHLVYARAFAFTDALTPDAARHYRDQHGFPPRVVVAAGRVYGIGPTEQRAALALTLAQDGALVQQLAAAFGGAAYMTDAARTFIENWEVESYRQQMLA